MQWASVDIVTAQVKAGLRVTGSPSQRLRPARVARVGSGQGSVCQTRVEPSFSLITFVYCSTVCVKLSEQQPFTKLSSALYTLVLSIGPYTVFRLKSYTRISSIVVHSGE